MDANDHSVDGEYPHLTGFQRDMLFVLAGLERPNGLTVKAKLEKYYQTEVNHGRLYPNLDELVDKALVEKGSKDRRTNYYEVTDKGARDLARRREWEDERLPDPPAAGDEQSDAEASTADD